MLRGWIKRGWQDEKAAVAPTVALTLFGLIAAGGLAFDYARMAALDTELQNAADQAALAAASQLDGASGAKTRATNAASNLVQNFAKFANDGNAFEVTIQSVQFCKTFTDSEPNTRTACDGGAPNTADDVTAKVAWVTVNPRQAVYALTPVVALFNSDDLLAEAVAGLSSAICKVPPVMMCNPDEPATNTDKNLDFDVASRIGRGLKLVNDTAWEPGAFGFLEAGLGTNDLVDAVSQNKLPGDCLAMDGVQIKGGIPDSVFDAFNMRFDIVPNGNACTGGNGNCSPSINVRKDLVRPTPSNCKISGGNPWQEVPANSGNYQSKRYRPTSQTLPYPRSTVDVMGFPRDVCHATAVDASCAAFGGTERFGNGVWDRDLYFKSNYNWSPSEWKANTGLSDTASRYDVYKWEYQHPDDAGSINTNQAVSGSLSAYSTPQAGKCMASITPPLGIIPGGDTIDRRRISVAVINCSAEGVNGGGNTVYKPRRWIDIFLVEPSLARQRCDSGLGCNVQVTDGKTLYVEVVGETGSGNSGGTVGQEVRHDMPYLIR